MVFFYLCLLEPQHKTSRLRITALGDLDHQPSLRSIFKSYLFVWFWGFFKYLFIWLSWVLVAVHRILDHCCGMLHLNCSIGNLVPWPGIKPWSQHWQHGVLAPGAPGQDQKVFVCVLKLLKIHTLGLSTLPRIWATKGQRDDLIHTISTAPGRLFSI